VPVAGTKETTFGFRFARQGCCGLVAQPIQQRLFTAVVNILKPVAPQDLGAKRGVLVPAHGGREG
jgi:hypothetical protein